MAFMEKAFDRVPRKVIWWALRKLGVDEWIVHLVQGMYSNARSCVRVGEGYSEEFKVKVGVHQGYPCFSSSCLKHCHVSFAVGSHGRKALDLGRSNGGERAESKCRKDKNHDL